MGHIYSKTYIKNTYIKKYFIIKDKKGLLEFQNWCFFKREKCRLCFLSLVTDVKT